MADAKRKASIQAGSEALYDKLADSKAGDSAAVVSDYMYHLGVGSDDPRLAEFKVWGERGSVVCVRCVRSRARCQSRRRARAAFHR